MLVQPNLSQLCRNKKPLLHLNVDLEFKCQDNERNYKLFGTAIQFSILCGYILF